MRKSILIIAAACLMGAAACNRETLTHPYDAGSQVIAFDTYAGGVTKTAAITTANIQNFGAAAYTGSVEVMDNQLVEGGNGAWSYTPIKYWPQSGALYFSAYAPYATASNGITPSYNTSTRTFDLSYAMPEDEADQVDLLMASNVEVADCSAHPAKVQFTFGHILSRVGLTARYTGSVSAGTTVSLTDVKVSGKFIASGDYTVSGGWANQSASASTVIYDRPAARLAATALTTSAQNLLAGDDYVMLIPNGDVAMEGTITVTYKVRTSDGVEMEYVKDASSPLSYEPNKTYIYNLIIDLDADAIEFGDVTVLDWGATVEQDVEVRSYSNKLSVAGLSFSTSKRTAEYTVTSVREYEDGEVEQIPWHAEFSTDGGNTYSETVPEFFDTFTSSDSQSGTYTASTSKSIGDYVDIRLIQEIEEYPFQLDDAAEYKEVVEIAPSPLTFEILSDGTITWVAMNAVAAKTISYKLNDSEWTEITSSISGTEPSIEVTTGDIVEFKGRNDSYCTLVQSTYGESKYGNKFNGTASFIAKGNIMSLIYGDDFSGHIEFPQNSSANFVSLFSASNVQSATELELPAITLTNNCYLNLFSNCKNLVSAPELPATTLADYCYQNLFSGCENLGSAPELPATILAKMCYAGMFKGCSNLSTPPELPATTLALQCYGSMFEKCVSLTSAPQLPATTLVDGCYFFMFNGCTNLTSAPELPATILSKSCYERMFTNCSNLESIKCLAENISANSCLTLWTSGVSNTGTFIKSPSMASWPSGTSGIPSGWTIQDAE